MPLTFAGILPTTPELLPEFQSEAHPLQSMVADFEQQLYLAKPEVILILADTAATIADTCTLHVAPEFHANLSQLGDFSKEVTWKGTPDMAAQLLHHSYEAHVPLKLESSDALDSESVVALELVGSHLDHIKVLPVGSMIESVDTNISVGRLLHEYIANTSKRVAVITTGHLAATHSDDSPYGTVDGASAVDELIRSSLSNGNCDPIHTIDPNTVTSHHPTLYTPLLILSGICSSIDAHYTELGYHVHHGVGYTIGTMNVT